jgi:hypothetical protein
MPISTLKRTLSATILVLAVCAQTVFGLSPDMAELNATLWYSEVAYCGDYMTRNYDGMMAGFVPTYQFDEEATKHDTAGFIGYNPNTEAIYIVFRGSSTIDNWITNIDAVMKDYPNCEGCKVHAGFYHASTDIYPQIESQVTTLQNQYPNYRLVLTGHSLGAALATLTAIQLHDEGHAPNDKVEVYNYGSPRIFNEHGGDYATKVIDTRVRVTHHKDVVPHIPTNLAPQHFFHMTGEWYEDPTAELASCTGGEDSNCADQWNLFWEWSVDDHLMYMGMKLGEGGCEYINSL